MDKSLLAQELREAQKQLGEVSARVIEALSDDEIIDAYITCSCCGVKAAEGTDLEYAITTAANKEAFFERIDQMARIKHQISQSEPDAQEMSRPEADDEEEDILPVYEHKDIKLFFPKLIWSVYEIDDAEDLFLNLDAILQTPIEQLFDAQVWEEAEQRGRIPLTPEQARRLQNFKQGRFWLESLTAELYMHIGEAEVNLSGDSTLPIIASDATQEAHRRCEESALNSLFTALERMGLDRQDLERKVRFERWRETPGASELRQLSTVPGKQAAPPKPQLRQHRHGKRRQ